MKKALFILMMLMILGIVFSYAQCGRSVVVTGSRTEYLDANKKVERTVDEPSTIEFSKGVITITHGVEAEQMTGTIKSDSCNWTIPYKEGKSVIKAILSDPRGDTKNLTITLEGKDGKLSFLAEAEEVPDRKIRMIIDKFEEKK